MGEAARAWGQPFLPLPRKDRTEDRVQKGVGVRNGAGFPLKTCCKAGWFQLVPFGWWEQGPVSVSWRNLQPGSSPLSLKTSPFSFQDSTAIPAGAPRERHGGWPGLLPDADHLLLVTTRKRRSTKKPHLGSTPKMRITCNDARQTPAHSAC